MDPMRHSTNDATSPTPPNSAWALVATVAATEAIGLSAVWALSPTTETALLLLALGLPWLAATVCLGTTVLPKLRSTANPALSTSAPMRRVRLRDARSWRLAIDIAVALALISVGLFAQSIDATEDPTPSPADTARGASAGATAPAALSQKAPFQITTTPGQTG